MADNSNLSLLKRNLNDNSIESIPERLSENSNSLSGSSGEAKNKFAKINNNLNNSNINNSNTNNGIDIMKRMALKKKKTVIKSSRKSLFSDEMDEPKKQNNNNLNNFQTGNAALIKSKRASLPGFNSFFLNNLRTLNTSCEGNLSKLNSKKNISGNLNYTRHYTSGDSPRKNANYYTSITNYKPNPNNNRSGDSFSFEANFLPAKRDSNRNVLGTVIKHRSIKKIVTIEDYLNSFDKIYINRQKIINNMKILHFLLVIFSISSIVFSYVDSSIYNKNSWNFLKENFNDIFANIKINYNLIKKEHFKYLEKRKITNKENSIRIVTMILNFLCTLIVIIINWQRHKYTTINKKGMELNKLNFHAKRPLKNGTCGKTSVAPISSTNSTLMATMTQMEENMTIKMNKYYFIFICVANLAFYPPYVNKVNVYFTHDYYYVYTANNIFLLISYVKLFNVIRGLLYISNVNSLPSKMVCKTYLLELDYVYMFKLYLNKYPFILSILLLILLSILTSIFIKGGEYYTINKKTGLYNNKGLNDFKNFFNSLYLFYFISLRIVFGDIVDKTTLGKLILLISGVVGSICCSYFIYLINKKIEFTDDEEKAYSKLSKLFEPENNEHKASNLIKYLLFYKKIILDNSKLVNTYKLKIITEKKEKLNSKKLSEEILQLRTSLRMSFSSQDKLEENTKYKLREKFVKYIEVRFIHKLKFLNENRNFKDKFKISRNYSLPFSDVIKTIIEKMEANMDSLCIKLDPMNDIYSNMGNLNRIHCYVSKKLTKIYHSQNNILDYLVKHNNASNVDYYENKQIKILNRSMIDDDANSVNSSNKMIRKVKSKYVGYQNMLTKSNSKMKSPILSNIKKTKSSFINKNEYTFPKKQDSVSFKESSEKLEFKNGKNIEDMKKRSSYDARPKSHREIKKDAELNVKQINKSQSKNIVVESKTLNDWKDILKI